MTDLKEELKRQLQESTRLLEKESVLIEELVLYKVECHTLFAELLDKDYDSTLSDLARQGRDYSVTKFENRLIQRIYNFLTEARNDITYNAPYLKKRTDSDYRKTYVFWTKKRLEGIVSHIEAFSKT